MSSATLERRREARPSISRSASNHSDLLDPGVPTPDGLSRSSSISATGSAYQPSEDVDGTSTPSTATNPYDASTDATGRSSRSSLDGIDITSAIDGGANLGLPISDLYETYFSPHIDLLDRKLRKVGDGLRRRAKRINRDELIRRARTRDEVKLMNKELARLRAKATRRVEKLQAVWMDSKSVRLREKISFVVGIMNLVASSLLFALRPEWIPYFYTLQSAYFFPLRIYSYFKLRWHLFLFDYCYFANSLNLVYIWLFPSSTLLFTVCFCAAHGPLCISIATWRNSFVPHSIDRITSLFLHLYPLLTFVSIRHAMPAELAERHYPALRGLPRLDSRTALAINVAAYCAWQFAYYEAVARRKRDEIASGRRVNSYSTLSQGKGLVARLLSRAPESHREPAFMLLQFVYTIVCMLPSPYFYHSRVGSYILLLSMLTLSVWNGASFYLDYFARRFEKELVALRAEMERARAYGELLGEEAEPSAADGGGNGDGAGAEAGTTTPGSDAVGGGTQHGTSSAAPPLRRRGGGGGRDGGDGGSVGDEDVGGGGGGHGGAGDDRRGDGN